MNIYDFSAKMISGEEVSFKEYRGKVLLIVNTASKCNFTPQYQDLEKIYEKYKEKNVEILGFPCNQFNEQEPGKSEEVKTFCEINYGVTFQLFEKIDVRGSGAHPIFKFLSEEVPFKGFDLNKISGKLIYEITMEKYPEFVVDNSIKWNFTKFLIDREGNVVGRFEPTVEPLDIVPKIKELL